MSNKDKMKNILNKKLIYEVLSVVIARTGLLPVFLEQGAFLLPEGMECKKTGYVNMRDS